MLLTNILLQRTLLKIRKSVVYGLGFDAVGVDATNHFGEA